MKLTKFYSCLKSNKYENKYYLVNLLYGYVERISLEEYKIIVNWEEKGVNLGTIDEVNLYNQLNNRRYIVEDAKEECLLEERVLAKCKLEHKDNIKDKSVAYFVLTYNCNFGCPYCYEKDQANSNSVMSKQMVDQIYKLHEGDINQIRLFGGEPFLLTNKDIIKYIINKFPKAKYSALTNGYYLEEIINMFDEVSVEFFQVTLDGDINEHDKCRTLKNGNGTFNKIIKGIDKCLEKNIRIKVRVNLTQENLDGCLSFRERFMKERKQYVNEGLLYFEMQPIFQIPYDKKKKINEIVLENDYELSRVLNCSPYQCNVMLSTASTLTQTILTNNNTIKPKYSCCDVEEDSIFYDSDGNMYSCILAVGNVEESIGKYLPDLELKSFSMFNRNIETISNCVNCKYRFICGGGCPHYLAKTGKPISLPNCHSLDEELNNLINICDKFKEN